MHKDIVFNAAVKNAVRDEDDSKWQLQLVVNGEPQVKEFDKVAFCHGYQTLAKTPKFEGAELFQGEIMHTQAFRM